MGNVDKLGNNGDEAKKMSSVVKIEEIQKVDESTTLQLPVATVHSKQQRWYFPQGRRGKIIFWVFVIGFGIMLLILILLASILGVRAHAKSTSSSSHTKSSSTHTASSSVHRPSSTSAYGSPTSTQSGITCTVTPAANGKDSAAVIRKAFKSCGRATAGNRNRIVFQNTTYTIGSVLETTNLKNVDIELHGTLSWDNSNIQYWLNHSLPVGYQNQSTAWRFGGDGISFQGYGAGTFNGNGDVWYRYINGRSNYPGRPHQLTITDTTNSKFEGLNFLQSQMWTMTVIHSSDVLLQDIYVNNTSKTGAPTVNTDGCDSIYANNITFRRWTVDNGDDGISPKANSTNILIEDSQFYRGSGIALGSIGQMNGQFETIENVTCRNITLHNTKNGAYIKTWTGVNKGLPPNGGGGGFGYAQNLVFENFKLINVQKAFTITQCTNFEGNKGDCDTSKFNIRNVYLSNFTGTVRGGIVSTMQCSAAAPCRNIHMSNIVLENSSNHTTPRQYQCDSVKETVGFVCTGPPDGEDNAF
ncbi:pectin lyase-like protein [Aureobasidium sp. EXF-8845]|nr:pectin lyase-like protein [Aureobasidium sp. EXF-8845]